jgi:hypothetical protein
MRRTVVLLAALGLAVAACRPAPPSARQAGTQAADPMRGSTRFEQNGWIYVHLEGPPAQLGYQHGALLAPEIADMIRVLGPYLKQTTTRDWAFYREASERVLWPKIDAEYQAEIDGIVAGAKSRGVAIDRWDVVAVSALEELSAYYVPWLDKQQGKAPSTKSPGNCSAFVATGSQTADGRIVIGHNNWTPYLVGQRWNIIFDLKPEQGFRILMDGLPGSIASNDDFGINADGLLVTETTITGFFGFDPAGTPEFFRARKALQYSRSIDDYVRIMREGNNGGYANDWLLGDNKTGEIALFELGLKNWTVDRTKNGYFVGANFPNKPKLIKEETTFDVANKASSPNARRARWEELMAKHKGTIDVEVGKAFEADKYDVILKKDGPTERTLCGTVETSPRGVPEWTWAPYFPGGTVQAKVMDSTMIGQLEMWASMGRPCTGDFKADQHLTKHPEFGWMKGLLRDMPSQPWTRFRAGMTDESK